MISTRTLKVILVLVIAAMFVNGGFLYYVSSVLIRDGQIMSDIIVIRGDIHHLEQREGADAYAEADAMIVKLSGLLDRVQLRRPKLFLTVKERAEMNEQLQELTTSWARLIALIQQTRQGTAAIEDLEPTVDAYVVAIDETTAILESAFTRQNQRFHIVVVASAIISFVALAWLLYSFRRKVFLPLKDIGRLANELIEDNKLPALLDPYKTSDIAYIGEALLGIKQHLHETRANFEGKIKAQEIQLSTQLIDAENSKKAILNLLEDIEEDKKKVEETVVIRTKELREERSRMLASINSLQIGFAMIDLVGVITLQNPALNGILRTNGDITTLDQITERLKVEKSLLAMLQDCIEKRCVTEIKEISLENKYVRVFMTPVFTNDEEARPLGGVILVEDITEAKAIDKAKTEFVSLASHQLRTPLSTINWYVEMLLSGDAGKLTDDQKIYVDEIYVGNQRMVALVNALLNVSRLELGTVKVDVQPMRLQDLSHGVVEELEKKITEQKLTVKEEYDDKAPAIPVDQTYLRMVMQNLVTNAVKYTPEGGTVTVMVTNLPTGTKFGKKKSTEDSVGFAVSDTGFGIPKEQQKRIFQKLFRADNVLDKDEEGTGLGLYMVKAIIDQTVGSVWFDSVENEGTTFYVMLPVTGMKPKEGEKSLT